MLDNSLYTNDTERMEIILNKKELEKDGLTEDSILGPIRSLIFSYGGTEPSHGIFELSGIDTFAIMGSIPGKTVKANPDILKYFKVWKWYHDGKCTDSIKSMTHYLKEVKPIVDKLMEDAKREMAKK